MNCVFFDQISGTGIGWLVTSAAAASAGNQHVAQVLPEAGAFVPIHQQGGVDVPPRTGVEKFLQVFAQIGAENGHVERRRAAAPESSRGVR